MKCILLDVQQAGIGLVGWILVMFVLVPVLGSLFKGNKDEKKP